MPAEQTDNADGLEILFMERHDHVLEVRVRMERRHGHRHLSIKSVRDAHTGLAICSDEILPAPEAVLEAYNHGKVWAQSDDE